MRTVLALMTAAFAALTVLPVGHAARRLPQWALGFAEPAAEASDAGSQIVIPPGQEKVIGDMLGLGATLPGVCHLTDGDADGPVIRAQYACPDGAIEFDLTHPSAAPSAAPHTAQFALVLRSGTPPPGLSDAILSLVRAHEGEFHWLEVVPNAATAPPATRSRWPVVVGLVALAALVWALWRRRSRRARP